MSRLTDNDRLTDNGLYRNKISRYVVNTDEWMEPTSAVTLNISTLGT